MLQLLICGQYQHIAVHSPLGPRCFVCLFLVSFFLGFLVNYFVAGARNNNNNYSSNYHRLLAVLISLVYFVINLFFW